jgi:hypothetical protein
MAASIRSTSSCPGSSPNAAANTRRQRSRSASGGGGGRAETGSASISIATLAGGDASTCVAASDVGAAELDGAATATTSPPPSAAAADVAIGCVDDEVPSRADVGVAGARVPTAAATASDVGFDGAADEVPLWPLSLTSMLEVLLSSDSSSGATASSTPTRATASLAMMCVPSAASPSTFRLFMSCRLANMQAVQLTQPRDRAETHELAVLPCTRVQLTSLRSFRVEFNSATWPCRDSRACSTVLYSSTRMPGLFVVVFS